SVGRLFRLKFETAMECKSYRNIHRGLIPSDRELLALFFIQDWELIQRKSYFGDDTVEKSLVVPKPTFYGGIIEKVGVVVTLHVETARTFYKVEKKVEVKGAFRIAVASELQTKKFGGARIAINIENDFNKRGTTCATRYA